MMTGYTLPCWQSGAAGAVQPAVPVIRFLCGNCGQLAHGEHNVLKKGGPFRPKGIEILPPAIESAEKSLAPNWIARQLANVIQITHSIFSMRRRISPITIGEGQSVAARLALNEPHHPGSSSESLPRNQPAVANVHFEELSSPSGCGR